MLWCSCAKYDVSPVQKEGGRGHKWRQIISDWRPISFLICLYILQGLPVGLMGAIQLFIRERNSASNDHATFFQAGWPYSLKLLWAPLVDALYFERMGRRKSWLVPVLYLSSATLLFLSFEVEELLDSMQINKLTIIFLCLNFLAATQDIVVDAWALTMLRRENVGILAACNITGQSIGGWIGFAFIKYLKSFPNNSSGIMILSHFMQIWALIFFLSSSIILLFKKDGELGCNGQNAAVPGKENSIVTIYLGLWRIMKLPATRKWLIFLFTSNIAFATDIEVATLKIAEAGLTNEVRATLSVILDPGIVITAILLLNFTSSNQLRTFIHLYCFRVVASGIMAVMVWVTSQHETSDGRFSPWYMTSLFLVRGGVGVVGRIMVMSQMSFNARISDPAHGAKFMALYNTVAVLGDALPATIALILVDTLTIKTCTVDACIVYFDGYYIEVIACMTMGLLWMFWGKPTAKELEADADALGN